MNTLTDLLLILLVAGLIVVYLSSTAGRLDRVHRRIETAAAALDAQLLRRAALAADVADSGLLDPAASLLLADTAWRAATTDPSDAGARSIAESDLTRVLAEVFERPEDIDEVFDAARSDSSVRSDWLN